MARKRYVIEYTFIDGEEVEGYTMALVTDNPVLNGRFIPLNCYVVTLYKREEYDNLLRVRAEEQSEDAMTDEERQNDADEAFNELINFTDKFDDDGHYIGGLTEKDSEDDEDSEDVEELEEEIENFGSIDYLKKVYIGEKMPIAEIVDQFGVNSPEYMYAKEYIADGIIYFEEENDFVVVDTYNNDEDFIIGGLTYSGNLVIDKECEYVETEDGLNDEGEKE